MSRTKTKLSIDWQIADKGWGTLKINPKTIGAKAIRATLDYLGTRDLFSKTELTILLANDAKLQELNKQYRGKNKPTNVLSFPTISTPEAEENTYLGDIAISFNTLYNEALEQKKAFQDHYTHLVVHSVLHLLGHDHENRVDAKIMENLEKTILSLMNIKNPYE